MNGWQIALLALVTCAGGSAARVPRSSGPFAVGMRVMRFVDPTRTILLPSGRREPRALVTYVRYPALGPPGFPTVAAVWLHGAKLHAHNAQLRVPLAAGRLRCMPLARDGDCTLTGGNGAPGRVNA